MKIKKLTSLSSVFALLATFLTPFSAFAVTNSVSIACPSSAAIGSTATCTISGHATDQITEISAVLKSDNLTIQSFIPDAAWAGSVENGVLSLTTSGASESFTIGVLTVQPTTVNTAGIISLSNIIFKNGSLTESSVSGTATSITTTAADVKSESTEKKNTTTGVVESDATALSELKIEGFDINFSSDKYTYSLQIPKTTTSLKITATPKDPTSTVEITGNENLTDGSIVKITITNGEAKSIYRIKISVGQAVAATTTAESSSEPPIVLIIAIIAVVILIIIAAAVFLILRKKKQQARSIYNPDKSPATPFKRTPVNQAPSNTSSTPVNEAPSKPPVQPTPVPTPANRAPSKPPVTPVAQPTQPRPTMTSVQPMPQQAQPQAPAFKPTTPVSVPPAQPQPTRPISLDELPFNNPGQTPQEVASRLKKPTTPIVFES